MISKVYSFKPKGKGYRLYRTRTYSGKPNIVSNKQRSSGNFGDALIGMIAGGIARSLFGKKK